MQAKIDINTCVEFSMELILVVPYAYYLHKKGLLGNTHSAKDSKTLYYFSDNHYEIYDSRGMGIENASTTDLPNKWMHHNSKALTGKDYDDLTEAEQESVNGVIDYSEWEFPPYKEYYKNSFILFEKPLIVVSNKYNYEWEKPPVNFIDIPTLQAIFNLLREDYTVIYKRPRVGDFPNDENEKIKSLDITAHSPVTGLITDFDLCRLEGITVFDDVYSNFSKDMTYNEFQFSLYANCDSYISVQGGNCTVCNAFGKTNVCLIKSGKESRPGYFKKGSWSEKMNGCETIVAKSNEELIHNVKLTYLK